MKSVGHILGGSARFELLRALYYQHEAVGLRQLARLAGVHPHSAERMLKELAREGVVLKNQTRTRTLFERNCDHADWQILESVFDAADRAARKIGASRLKERARAILPFLDEAGDMLKKAKRSTHVP